MRTTCSAIFGLVSLAGCASVGVTRVRSAPPKPEDCGLDIYSAQEEVKRGHEVLCVIDATSGRTLGDDRTVRGALKQASPEACRCGADAMVIMSSTTTTANAQGWGEGTVVVRAIRYTEATEAAGAKGAAEASNPPAPPAPGSVRGPCLPDGSCRSGLVCASDLCVRLPPATETP